MMSAERELLVAIFEAYEAWRCLKTASEAGLSVAPSQGSDVMRVAQLKVEALVRDIVEDTIDRAARSSVYRYYPSPDAPAHG